MPKPSPTPQLDALIKADPDLVDRIFEYLVAEFPALASPRLDVAKRAVREHFGGSEAYVRSVASDERQQQATQVLALFNGRNASEVARRVGISRASVYRLLKQPGASAAKKKSQGSG
jgi:Mor family transcriptional regulator